MSTTITPPTRGSVVADSDALWPDITVYVTCDDERKLEFKALVTTRHAVEHEATEQPWNLQERPEIFVARSLAGLEQAHGKGVFASRLSGVGQKLFSKAPRAFQDVYWSLVDAGIRPQSILVHTEEAAVPWELMVPHRVQPGGLRVIEPPLGFQATVGRWLTTGGHAPTQTAHLTNGRVFAPHYKRAQRLRHSRKESTVVCDATGARSVRLDSHEALRSGVTGDVALVHIICHGKVDNTRCQVLILEDGAELWPEDIAGMDDLRQAFHLGHPVVFLNACEVGRGSPTLVGPGGFAAEFIDLGASCVIAPLWSVRDDIAEKVATEFYTRTTASPSTPFAEVLRDVRQLSTSCDEDSYAAYAFYGDPMLSRYR